MNVKRNIDFLLMGVPRSGTTALTAAINLHPDLLCGAEVLNDHQPHRDLDYPRALLELDSLPVKVRERLAQLISAKPNPSLIGNKLPRYYFNLESLLGQIPDARLLWIYRSPKQFCASWNKRASNLNDTSWHRGQTGIFGIFEILICIDAILRCKADVLMISFDSVFLHHQSAYPEILSFLGVQAHAPAVDAFYETYFKAPRIHERKYVLTSSEGKLLSAMDIQQLDDMLLPETPQRVDRFRTDLARYLDMVKPLAIEAFRQLQAEFSPEQKAYFQRWQSVPRVRDFLVPGKISVPGSAPLRPIEAPQEGVGKVTRPAPRVANPVAVTQQISFIIPLYNHLAQTQAMLASLQATMPAGMAYEIILIDDFSADGTRAWLATLAGPNIKTLLNPHNLGYARANNRAASVASGAVLALLNNDLLLSPGWLQPMLQTLLSPTLNAGLVGNVHYRVADGKLDHAGVQVNPNAQFGHIETLADVVPVHTRVLAVTGACMLLRKADFDAMGGFDEQFVNGGEDIDLCFKLRAAGKAIYVANTSRIRHHVGLSREVDTQRNERNSRHLFGRWRKVIKQELAARWAGFLQTGPHAYAGLLNGHLAPAFVATPHAAALVIAEAMLLHKEHRWARELGEAGPHADAADAAHQCTTRGLLYNRDLDGYALTPDAVFVFDGLHSVRNFYMCGRVTVDLAKQPVAITISVNGIQTQTATLTTGRNVNVGIIAPILLQGVPNHFQVSAQFVGPKGRLLGDASAAIVVTHIVIDDQTLSDL